MAAPVYLQSQVDTMLNAPKYVRFNAWENRLPGRTHSEEIRHRIKAFPFDPKDATLFIIESCHCLSRRQVSFSLFGKMKGYPEHALCRYEIQTIRHRNPDWFPPQYVGNRVLHKHVYSERAIREGYTWDKCAEVLLCRPQIFILERAIDHLTPLFLSELKIEIHDPDVLTSLFGRQ